MSALRSSIVMVSFLTMASASSAGKKATVTVINESLWDLFHMYLSPVDENEWGPDQLGEHVVKTGESFELSNIPCESYDVRLVDEDGDECVLTDVDICGGSETWKMTSEDLLACEMS